MNSRNEFGSQTEFALEEPLFSPSGTAAPEKEVEQLVKIPWWKKKPLVIAAIVSISLSVIVLLLIINMIIVASRRPGEPVIGDATPLPVTPTEPLVKRIEEIELQLKSANPNQPQFAFPAVDFSIRIDEKSR